MVGANKELLSEKIKNLFNQNNNSSKVQQEEVQKENVVVDENDTNF